MVVTPVFLIGVVGVLPDLLGKIQIQLVGFPYRLNLKIFLWWFFGVAGM